MIVVRPLHRLLFALALVLAPALGRAQDDAPVRVQVGGTVRPQAVTVGDPFVVTVRVRAPRGARIEFPVGPEAGPIELLDSRTIATAPDTGAAEQTARYRLVAWEAGPRPIGLPAVVVTLNGAERRLSLADLRVQVRSVLPEDSAQRVPKPAKPPVEIPGPWWWPWGIVLLAALALLALLWWWLRRRRRRSRAAAPPEDPLLVAEREFDRVLALGLLEAGERGRFVALVVEVLRDYLARRMPVVDPSCTSTEVVAVLRRHGGLPVERLAVLLQEADLVKFARRPVTADRARLLEREARAIARDVHARLAPPPSSDSERAA